MPRPCRLAIATIWPIARAASEGREQTPPARLELESDPVHQIIDYLSFTAGLVATILKSLYGTLAELLSAAAWAAVAAAVFALFLYSRLASRMDNLEISLELLNAKLDSIQSHLTRPRTNSELRDTNDKSRT